MMRGPTPQPGAPRERLVLGIVLVLAGAVLVALGSLWGWIGVAAGVVLVVTSGTSVEDATATPTTRTVPTGAEPIEPDDGVALGKLLPLAIAALVLGFKFGAVA